MSGFKSEADLRAALYPDVVLFSLAEDHRWRLRPFHWASQELVCIPAEKAHLFQNAKP